MAAGKSLANSPKRWQFVTDLHGQIEPYTLEPGVIYEFSCLLSPGSRMRIVDEHGNSRFAAKTTTDKYFYPVTHSITFDSTWGETCAIQYQGEISDIYFRMSGINRELFNK